MIDQNDVMTITLNDNTNGFALASKMDIMNGRLHNGIYIKAIPIDPNKSQKEIEGILLYTNNELNLYSKLTMKLRYRKNGSLRYTIFQPIKYDVYYKEVEDEDNSKRKIFLELLDFLEKSV
jgi:hypothetical protein